MTLADIHKLLLDYQSVVACSSDYHPVQDFIDWSYRTYGVAFQDASAAEMTTKIKDTEEEYWMTIVWGLIFNHDTETGARIPS